MRIAWETLACWCHHPCKAASLSSGSTAAPQQKPPAQSQEREPELATEGFLSHVCGGSSVIMILLTGQALEMEAGLGTLQIHCQRLLMLSFKPLGSENWGQTFTWRAKGRNHSDIKLKREDKHWREKGNSCTKFRHLDAFSHLLSKNMLRFQKLFQNPSERGRKTHLVLSNN